MRILISDMHAGCQMWQASLLKSLGHDVTIDSFSGHHHLIEDSLKKSILNRPLGKIVSESDAEKLAKSFDIIISSFPPSFIMKFKNVTGPRLILNAGHRLHIHTDFTPEFLDFLKSGRATICSMSKYDTEYIKHYTGIHPIELDVVCFHIEPPTQIIIPKQEILITPAHVKSVSPFNSIEHMNLNPFGIKFTTLKQLYGNYKYQDIIGHPAAVLFPYSAFSISMVELYEMNIPTFVPSKSLLIKLNILDDVLLHPLYATRSQMASVDVPHVESSHRSPNSDTIVDRLYWMDYMYFNVKENFIYWDSIDDLFHKLTTTNLKEVSRLMEIENNKHREQQLKNWKTILN